jgi:hypothetical protein
LKLFLRPQRYSGTGCQQSVVLRIGLALFLYLDAGTLRAQEWNRPDVDSLVERAVVRRSQVDAALRAWTADALGTLEFLVELGDGAVLPPRVVKLEQLASKIRWQTPGNTQQRIIGRRDTLLFPGDVGFYSDRYGVVTNNLGDRIRLGDGHDVRDLPHPLSDAGRPGYEFAAADSLSLSVPGRRVEVYELLLRPRNPKEPGMVGSVYLDRATGDLVRLAVTFTRSAILDQRIERLGLILENLLVEGTWWLPYTQELEVVRAATWFDFPTKGIVRGRWRVLDHAVVADPDVPLPPPLPTDGRVLVNLPGQRIGLASPRERSEYRWTDSIASALAPEEQLTKDDVAAVRRQAEAIVQERALERVQHASLGGRGISDLFHVTRVEGVAFGLAGRIVPGPGWSVGAQVSYGFSDDVVKGRLELGWRPRSSLAFGLFGERRYRDAGDVQEVSGVRNTISSQVAGDDNTDPFDVQGAGAWVRASFDDNGLTWLTAASLERQRSVSVNASPWSGSYRSTIPALALDAVRFDTRLTRGLHAGPWGATVSWMLNGRVIASRPLGGAGTGDGVTARLAASAVVQLPAGATRLHLETHGGVVGGSRVPTQELVRYGGIVSGPGYGFHQFAGREAVSQRVEWRVPVPFVSVPLLKYGRTPRSATLAPYAHVVCVGGREVIGDPTPAEGCFPSVGVGFSALFDLVRFDLAHGFREGGWKFGVDVGRIMWGIL